ARRARIVGGPARRAGPQPRRFDTEEPVMPQQERERRSIDTIRALAMDAVEKANAGHPGTAMALAPLGYTLFIDELRINPADTHWPDRDRFVLSSGHACVLQYA